MKKQKVFAVIPAYNEERYIAKVIAETKKYVDTVIVVDDGSKDNTYNHSIGAGAKVLKHVINLGKGASLKTGFDYAVKEKADILIALDADAQHDPKNIPEMLKRLDGKEIVLAYRKLNKNMPGILRFGNWFINKTIKFLYGVKIKDSQCGYRIFTKNAYKRVRWKSSDYSMESEMIAKIGKYNIPYAQFPIGTVYSDRYKGTTVLDGVKIVFNLLMWKLNGV